MANEAKPKPAEGSPDGIEGGTSAEAREGDLYQAKLYALFRRGWTVPTVIPDAERDKLMAVASVEVGRDMRILGVRIVQSSGNALFDQSIIARVQEVQETGTALPDPPKDLDSMYRGTTIRLAFHGREAAR